MAWVGFTVRVEVEMLTFPGGYIDLHVDSIPQSYEGPSEWLLRGERVMTFMVYLSSVEVGGNTAFPLLGLTVPPRQGSALFWHTVTSSGYQDQRMKHLGRIIDRIFDFSLIFPGCPVVFGDKWIVNKWVKWQHHMFTYPCYADKGRFYSIDR